MADVLRANLERVMAAAGLTIVSASQRTGLDARTLRGILRGSKRPRLPTLNRLAAGLGVSVDELLLEPIVPRFRQFDRQTNPAVEEAVCEHPQLFADWTEAEFDELASQFGAGGALTPDGVLRAARHIAEKRELHQKLDLLLESTHGPLVRRIVEALHAEMVIEPGQEKPSAPGA